MLVVWVGHRRSSSWKALKKSRVLSQESQSAIVEVVEGVVGHGHRRLACCRRSKELQVLIAEVIVGS
jgi:hypothetical protein